MSRVYVVRLIRDHSSDFPTTTRCLLLCTWDTQILPQETAVRRGHYLGGAKTLDKDGNSTEKLDANGVAPARIAEHNTHLIMEIYECRWWSSRPSRRLLQL